MIQNFLGAMALTMASQAALAVPITINFDAPLADYTPGAIGTQQDINTWFSSLGILFADVENGGSPSVGDCTGGSLGSNPFHLYGNASTGGAVGRGARCS